MKPYKLAKSSAALFLAICALPSLAAAQDTPDTNVLEGTAGAEVAAPGAEKPAELVPLKVELVPTVGTAGTTPVAARLSLNILAGRTAEVDGVEVGTILNLVDGDVNGAQLSGVANVNHGRLDGVQVAGTLNYLGQSVDGVQAAGVASMAGDRVDGVQASGAVSVSTNEVSGAQVAGVGALALGAVDGAQVGGVAALGNSDVDGVQVAGVASIANGTLDGVQVSGVSSVADSVDGVQVAGVANVSGDVAGVQAAVVNVAGHVSGTQIGVINVARSSDAPVGLINIIADGYHHLEADTSLQSRTVTLKLGGTYTYSLLSMSLHDFDDRIWTYQAGFGGHIPLSNGFYTDIDGRWGHIVEGRRVYVKNQVGQARVSVGKDFAPHFGVFAGAAYNITLTDPYRDVNLSNDFRHTENEDDWRIRQWPNVFAGARF